MKEIKEGQILNIQAYKHDGTLYKQWNGVKVLKVSTKEVVLFMYKTKVQKLKGSKWVISEPSLWHIPYEKWFNSFTLVRNQCTYFYTNISSPPIFEENTIKFVDYDLDVKYYNCKNPTCKNPKKMKIVDKKEYTENSQKYRYSRKLQKIIQSSLEEVKNAILVRKGFFNPKKTRGFFKQVFNKRMLPRRYENLLKREEVKTPK